MPLSETLSQHACRQPPIESRRWGFRRPVPVRIIHARKRFNPAARFRHTKAGPLPLRFLILPAH
jgi:hypothetical protein